METSEKLILIGLGGILGIIGFILHWFPEDKVKKNRIVCVFSFIVGTILIMIGFISR